MKKLIFNFKSKEAKKLKNHKNILGGKVLREGDHVFLATCPKHGGGYLKDTPLQSKSGSLANHPVMGKAEKRGYCIKREAFIELIADSIGSPLASW